LLPHTKDEHHILLFKVILVKYSVGFGKDWIGKQPGLKVLLLTDFVFVCLHLGDHRSLLFLTLGFLEIDKPVIPF
jgi:hypothetical protein